MLTLINDTRLYGMALNERILQKCLTLEFLFTDLE